MKSTILRTALLLFLSINAYAQIIDGYTDKRSYRAGDIVTFYTKTAIDGGNILMPVVDFNGTIIPTIINYVTISNNKQSFMNTVDPHEHGFNYAETGYWQVPFGLPSGMYFLITDLSYPHQTLNNTNEKALIPFIIKADDKGLTDVVVVVPTNSDAAYCYAGGKSLYIKCNDVNAPNHCNGNSTGDRAKIVSFQRPIWPQNQHSVFYNGFLNWMVTATPNPFNGKHVNVISDQDMEDYSEISNAKLLIIIGHSEYWTRLARKNFDAFVDAGKHAMVLSGNSFWWQVRYQYEPGNPGNPQMVCFKSSIDDTSDPTGDIDDLTGNPFQNTLLRTVHWNEPSLKYSILGSIGADWRKNRTGTTNIADTSQDYFNYTSKDGYKIILDNSPLLIDYHSGNKLITNGTILNLATHEFDTSIYESNLDNNGNPVIDNSALGFYRSELLGYAIPYSSNGSDYAPILVFQKTKSSGVVINTSSTNWCQDYNFTGGQRDGTKVMNITLNMINRLLYDDENIFTSPAPTSVSIKSNSNSDLTVSYQACSDGLIDITPNGIFVPNGFKVDHMKDGSYNNHTAGINGLMQKSQNDPTNTPFDTPFLAHANDCSGPINAGRYAAANVITSTNIVSNEEIKVFPNPTEDKLNIEVNKEKVTMEMYNMLGELVSQTQLQNGTYQVDVDNLSSGMYILKFISNKSIYQTRIIKK